MKKAGPGVAVRLDAGHAFRYALRALDGAVVAPSATRTFPRLWSNENAGTKSWVRLHDEY